MKANWLTLTGAFLLLGLVILAGCSKSSNPTQANAESGAVLAAVSASVYTNADGFGGTNEGSGTPQGFNGMWGNTQWDTLKPVRFVRWYTGNTRSVTVDSINASRTRAWVTVTHDLSGNFYDNSSFPYNPNMMRIRPIADDKWVCHVYLEKNPAGVWKVMKLSPIEGLPANPAYPITIVSVEYTASPSAVHYLITTVDTLYTREELPTFQPGDSVTARVTVSVSGDSSWTFLHRWGRPWPWHLRRPFYRTSLSTFQRTWLISAEDSVFTTPAIRHAAIDVIGMRALFGDSAQPYNCHVWGFPYTVKNPQDPYPD